MSNYSLRISTRPKRLAFIIDSATFTPIQFNLLAFFCMGLWGGRNHAIIPSNGGEISPEWLDYLKRSDPDFLLSLCVLEPEAAKEVDSIVLPCASFEFDVTGTDLQPMLGMLETIKMAINPLEIEASTHPIRELRPNTLPGVQNLTAEQVSTNVEFSFMVRNFGAGDRDRLHALSRNMRVRHLYFFSPGGPSALDRRHDDHHTHLTELSREGHAFTSRPDFQVIIGGDMNDLAYFWARAGIGPGPARAFNTLWLDGNFGEVDETMYAQVLARWISAWKGPRIPLQLLGRPPENNFGNRLSQLLGEVLSESVSFRPVRETDVASLVTSAEIFAQRSLSEDAHLINVFSEKTSFMCQKPAHLVDPSSTIGGWMVDISLRPNVSTPPAFSSFKDESWRLPQKRELWKIFLDEIREARITKTGVLSLPRVVHSHEIKFTMPSAEVFLKAILRRWNSDGNGTQEELWFDHIAPSDKARPLENILSQYDSTNEMALNFSNPMTNEIVKILLRRRQEEVQSRIDNLLSAFLESSDNSPDESGSLRARLARNITDTFFVEAKRSHFTFEDLLGNILNPGSWSEQQREEDSRRQASNAPQWRSKPNLKSALTALTEKKLVLHGSELKCIHCQSSEWYPIESVTSEVRCQGCNVLFPPAAPIIWSCAASAIFAEGLARHSMHPVILAITKLFLCTRDHLLFSPSMDIFLPTGITPEKREIDLLAFQDFKLLAVEVKSSITGLRDDLERTFSAAELIKPDVAIVALPLPSERDLDELQRIETQAAERLARSNIAFKVMRL